MRHETILILGGTGFLGRHLAARFLRDGDAHVIVYARDEKKHYEMRCEFANPALRHVIGDVRDAERLREVVGQADIIIHAAAMKHITHCEEHPGEAYRTNVDGAQNLIRVVQAGQKTVFISTDKAVAPINVYGATKMLMEGLFRVSGTNCVGVRYGNVLSSTGSVVPFFRAEARAGHKLPVTHPDMTRFLLPVREAVDLVQEAIACKAAGTIIVPRPRSARIADIAQVFAEKYKVGWRVVGPRPGEKLHESLLSERDAGLTELRNGRAYIRAASGGFENLKRDAALDLKDFVSSGPLMSLDELRAFLEEEGEL